MSKFIPEPVPGEPDWSNRWSIQVGEMKRALADIPDDYEIVLSNADVDELSIAELNITYLHPPTPHGNAGLVILEQGQVVTDEYDFEQRMETWLHYPQSGVKVWDEAEQVWKGDK